MSSAGAARTRPISNAPALSVSAAVNSRSSVRKFTDAVIPEADLRQVLEQAGRAASGGNVQPWKVWVLGPGLRDRLVAAVADAVTAGDLEAPEYDIYPQGMEQKDSALAAPYMARRRQLARHMYELMGVSGREDRAGRMAAMSRNFEFFDAPVGVMVSLRREMGSPQWADAGMFMATAMLLLRERGWHSCPQEAWAMWPSTVARVVGIPGDEILFAGMAVGKADTSYRANTLWSPRAPSQEWLYCAGYGDGDGANGTAPTQSKL